MTGQPKKLFFNDVQSGVLQLMPHDLVCEWGRGTGKGVVEAGRILYAVQHMPGSCLAMVAPSVKDAKLTFFHQHLCTSRSGATSETSTTSWARNHGRLYTGKPRTSSR